MGLRNNSIGTLGVWNYQSFIIIKMERADSLSILSHLINFAIIIYFVITLLKINALDMFGLLISFFGLFVSLIANIVAISERINT